MNSEKLRPVTWIVGLVGLLFLSLSLFVLIVAGTAALPQVGVTGGVGGFCLVVCLVLNRSRLRSLFTTGPGLRYLNTAVALLLLALIFVMISYIGAQRFRRMDLTRGGIFSLSRETQTVLRERIHEPLTITILFEDTGSLEYKCVRELLDRYRAESTMIQAEFIDPDNNPDLARETLRKYSLSALDVCIIAYRDRVEVLSKADMFHYKDNMGIGRKKADAFTGEMALTAAMLRIAEEDPITLCFTQGHKEPQLSNIRKKGEPGLGVLAGQTGLRNMRCMPINLMKSGTIPDECDVLVIVAPKTDFNELELRIIREYLFERRGSMMVFLDPVIRKPVGSEKMFFHENTLEPLLRECGFTLPKAYCLDPSMAALMGDYTSLIITDFADHKTVNSLRGANLQMAVARPVQPAEKNQYGFQLQPLMFTSKRAWLMDDPNTRQISAKGRKPARYPLAVCASRLWKQGENAVSSRIMVVGDSDFITNANLMPASRDFFVNSAKWMTEREHLISIGPEMLGNFRIQLAEDTSLTLSILLWGVLPLLSIVAGCVVWFIRRA